MALIEVIAVYFPYYTRTVVYSVGDANHCRRNHFHSSASACDGVACYISNAVKGLVQAATDVMGGSVEIASTSLKAMSEGAGERIDGNGDRRQILCQTAGTLLRATDRRRSGDGRQCKDSSERGELGVHVACVGGLQRIVGVRTLRDGILSFIR